MMKHAAHCYNFPYYSNLIYHAKGNIWIYLYGK